MRTVRYACGMRTVLALLLLLIASVALAGPARIVLTDGSIVVGEVRSMRGGVYRVETESLGLIEIDADRIVRIEQGGGGAAPGGASQATAGQGAAGQVRLFQQQISESPDLMRLILALQEDPELMATIADPSFLALLAAGDLDAIGRDPRMQKLLEHPGIREIIDRIAP